jgi:deazaflavin-dependent oxidoreductase (nitroreductase family)
MPDPTIDTAPKKPPAWFVHAAWRVHRALRRLSGGRFLWTTASKRGWGALHLTTTGRRSGQPRSVIVGYIEDGANLVTLAMNGWDEGHPAWWLNLQAHPDATVQLARQRPRPVRARAATGAERDRLWQRWVDADPALTAHAPHRSTETPIVVLERATAPGSLRSADTDALGNRGGFDAAADAELAQDVRDVDARRLLRHEQLGTDLAVGSPGGDEGEDLGLS